MDKNYLEEIRYRDEMLNLNTELNQFSQGITDGYANMRDIYRFHSDLSQQIEHNRDKIRTMRLVMREMEDYEAELEKERRDRDMLMENVYKERLEYEREEEQLQFESEFKDMKDDLMDVENDRDKTKGFIRMMMMHNTRNSTLILV